MGSTPSGLWALIAAADRERRRRVKESRELGERVPILLGSVWTSRRSAHGVMCEMGYRACRTQCRTPTQDSLWNHGYSLVKSITPVTCLHTSRSFKSLLVLQGAQSLNHKIFAYVPRTWSQLCLVQAKSVKTGWDYHPSNPACVSVCPVTLWCQEAEKPPSTC